MKNKISLDVDIADIIRDTHSNSKEMIIFKSEIISRIEKTEEAIYDIKEFAKEVKDTLLVHSKTMEAVSEIKKSIDIAQKDLELLKTQRAYIFGACAVLAAIATVLTYSAKSFVTENVRSEISSKETITLFDSRIKDSIKDAIKDLESKYTIEIK